MTLDLHQRRALALEVWNARDFVIDCREELGNAGADDETLRQLAININHLAKIAEDMETKTPEEIKLWGNNDNVSKDEEVNAAEDHESETQYARNGF